MSDADPHLEMAELTVGTPVTGAPAQAVGAAVVQLLLEDIVGGRLPRVVALTLKGTFCRIWRLIDIEPVDEVIRAVARREDAEAVVVVGPMPMPPGLEGDRCVAITAECESGAFDHLIVFKAGPQGEQFRICGRASDGHMPFRWFGVAPTGTVDLWVEGIVGLALGPRGAPRGSA